jgi:hypothetical protein
VCVCVCGERETLCMRARKMKREGKEYECGRDE